jgi:hypothetical protein
MDEVAERKDQIADKAKTRPESRLGKKPHPADPFGLRTKL